MPDDSAPITAAEAAQLAHQAQQEQAARNHDAIQPALAHAYTEIRRAASSDAGLTAVEIFLKDFNLTADQLLALSRALVRQGYRVQSHPASHRFTVGWQPAPVMHSAPLRGITTHDMRLGLALLPPFGPSLLREGPQEVGPAE